MARAALSDQMLLELNFRGPFTGMGNRIRDIEQAGYLRRMKWAAPLAVSTVLLAAVTLGNAVTTTVTTGITQPDFPRAVKIVTTLAGGNLVGSVVVNGTDINGNVIQDSISVAGGAATYTGVRAFATITSIVFPVRTTAGDTAAVQITDKFGLDRVLFSSQILRFQTDLAVDTFTLAIDGTEVAKNTIIPNTATNGAHNYRVLYLDERD